MRKLSDGERLHVWRDRNGWTQRVAATRMRMTRDEYARCERGERDLAHYGKVCPKDAPETARQLTPGERCRVYRWRTGARQGTICAEMKISRVWLNRMEMDREDATDLLCYWES